MLKGQKLEGVKSYKKLMSLVTCPLCEQVVNESKNCPGCSQLYCQKCIEQWIETTSGKCPKCDQNISKSTIVKCDNLSR